MWGNWFFKQFCEVDFLCERQSVKAFNFEVTNAEPNWLGWAVIILGTLFILTVVISIFREYWKHILGFFVILIGVPFAGYGIFLLEIFSTDCDEALQAKFQTQGAYDRVDADTGINMTNSEISSYQKYGNVYVYNKQIYTFDMKHQNGNIARYSASCYTFSDREPMLADIKLIN